MKISDHQAVADCGGCEKSDKSKTLLIRIGVALGIIALIEIITLIVQVSRPPV
jgi:hypothetical protein